MARAEIQRHQSHSAISPASQGGFNASSAIHGEESSAREQVRSPVLARRPNTLVQEHQHPDRRYRRIMAENTDAGEPHPALDDPTSPSQYLARIHRSAGFDTETGVSAAVRPDYNIDNINTDQPYNPVSADLADSAGMFQDANSFLDGSPSNDFSYEYAKLATEMADYITWNAADYTPWVTFHPDPMTQDTQNYIQYPDPRHSAPR